MVAAFGWLMGDTGSAGNLKIKAATEIRDDSLINSYRPDTELWFDTEANKDYFFEVMFRSSHATSGAFRFYHTGTTTLFQAFQYCSSVSGNEAALGASNYTGLGVLDAASIATVWSMGSSVATYANFTTDYFEGFLSIGASGGRFGIEWTPTAAGTNWRLWPHSVLYWQKMN